MAEPYLVWALAVGIAMGGAAVWFLLGRLPRRSDDVAPEELPEEAAWISRTIETRGGVAPAALVEEVLQLHLDYVAGEVAPPSASAPTDVSAEPDEAE